MDPLNIKTAKLSMESDGNIIGDAFSSKPEKDLGDKLGIIMGIIELDSLPDIFVDSFLEIISDLKTEYYLPPYETEYGVEKRFEECLSRANRRINKAINECVEAIDLKSIHVLIGLSHHNKIYLSQIGMNRAFLFHRRNKYNSVIVDIFAQAGEKKIKIDQEKMFSNIISGAISGKDSLLLCNDAILEYLSQNELSEIIWGNTLYAAIKEIEQVIREQNTNGKNFYAIIVQPEIEETENAMKEPPTSNVIIEKKAAPIGVHPQKSIDRLLDTQNTTEQYLIPSIMPNWKKVLLITYFYLKKATIITAKFTAKYAKIIAVKIWDWTKLGAGMLNTQWHRYWDSRREKKVFPSAAAAGSVGAQPLEPATDERTDEEIIAAEKISEQEIKVEIEVEENDEQTSEEDIIEKSIYSESNQPNPKHSYSAHADNLTLAEKFNSYLNGLIAKFLSLSKMQRALLIVGFLIFFLFSQSIVMMGRTLVEPASVSNDIQQIATQIQEQINQAEAQNIFNDESGAKASLAKAWELLNQIPDKRANKAIREDLIGKINKLNQVLQKMSTIENPKEVADLTKANGNAQASGLGLAGKNLLAFDAQNQSIDTVDSASGKISQQKITLTQAKKIVGLDANNALIWDGDKQIQKYSIDKKTSVNVLTLSEPITDFETYDGKLYTLRPEKNQVYKHFYTGDKFNSGSAWLKSGTDIKNALAIAMDGGAYIIRSGGQLNHYLKGQVEDIKFSPLSAPAIDSPKQIISYDQSNYVYILDSANARVVVYDMKGVLKRQYTSKSFTNLKAMAVDGPGKKIYLLNDNKIFQIDTDF